MIVIYALIFIVGFLSAGLAMFVKLSRKVRLLLVSIIMVMIAAFSAKAAFGFPDLVRHGYQACGSCHVAPNGGGALTAYGRSNAGQLLSTFDYKGAERPLLGLMEVPTWLSVGGDARYLSLLQKGEGFERRNKFWMQYDLELAVDISPALTLGGSYGRYGPDQEKETRKSYLKARIGDAVQVRVGKFIPTFGIPFPDHTVPTRQALKLGQGDETYNIEASYTSEHGEAFLTGIGGAQGNLLMEDQRGYSYKTTEMTGYAGSASIFIGSKAKIGASYLGLAGEESVRQAYSGHVLWGITDHVYILGEHARLFENDETHTLGYGRIGWELYRGIHWITTVEKRDVSYSYGQGVNFFPLAHWELTAEYKRSVLDKGFLDTAYFVFHHYL